MFTKPEQKTDYNQLELAILSWWKDQDILDKSIKNRPDDKQKTFYDGPITANGEPHYGHMLTFSIKDLIPRYWTMRGYKVSRSLGWDCQGLPVEYEVEKSLGFKEKRDIEKFGIEKFNQLCRESVFKFRDKIIELEERMGRLTNNEEEYATMDPTFIESIWWSLKELFDKGLLYEGFKVVPYSTRAGTTLSNAEVALGGYKPFTDPAVTVKFELETAPNTYLLAWTTTPWTLPTNFGLALGKEIDYVKVTDGDSKYILAKENVKNYFIEGLPTEPVNKEELIGQKYKPLFGFFPDKKNAYQIVYGPHVTTESGTGIVHLAPYGAEDVEIFKEVGIEPVDVLDDQGDFTSLVSEYSSMNYRDANPLIVEALKAKNLLFKYEDYTHDMPMCWRTDTPLIYKPITSWYISMSKLRSELVANNDKINWVPAHVKEGRFGNWLAEIKDWGISRSRYWGTPLPIWKSPSGQVQVFGSYAEIEALTGKKITDPHRPFVDNMTFEQDGETYTRVTDVLDVWYDSGAMPFARFHYPFENKEKFTQKFPAEFIAEGVDQTRGWFYTLHAISTALFGGEAFQNVVMNGFTLDDNGVKQSKSKKNYEPYQTLIEHYGVDAIRMNYFTSPISAGEDSTVSDKTVKAQVQEFILPLWNSFSYLITYANIHDWKPTAELAQNKIPFADMENELDAWILAMLQNTISEVTTNLDQYQIPRAGRALQAFITELSKWYIRRSRDRFAAGEQRALATLYHVLVEFAKLAAPFVPFITEHIYRTLVTEQMSGQPESIHLTDYPVADTSFLEQHKAILPEMKIVRALADIGQTIRANKAIKVRQPLARLEVQFSLEEDKQGAYLADWMAELVASELNVLEVTDIPKLSESDSIETSEDTGLGIKVGLETKLTPELAEAGLLREVIRSIQALRKNAGLQMGEAVRITYATDDKELAEVITKHLDEIKQTVSASELTEDSGEAEIKINDFTLRISLHR